MLKALDLYKGPVDGKVGEETRDAVMRFQSEKGLPPTGEVNAELIDKLARIALMPGSRPPFRADHVGSFLRPERLRAGARPGRRGRALAARSSAPSRTSASARSSAGRKRSACAASPTASSAAPTSTSTSWSSSTASPSTTASSPPSSGRTTAARSASARPSCTSTAPVRHARAIQGADFDFLKAVTTRTPKVTIPSPSMLHFRGGRQAISEQVYPDLERFYDDLTAAYRAEIADLAARGCRYLQLDDTNLAYLCDPAIREATRARGDDPDDLTRLYCRLVNDAIRDRPADMVACTHLCRGNFKSAWVAQGGYEPVAEILFRDMGVDGFFLEYDDERSGDFAPLRFMPKGKTVVLGLMSSKRPEVEPADQLRRRIDEAARYVPLEQCALSHQCGFSSTAHGNELAEDDQWRKLARCVEVAEAVWGHI